MRKASTSRPRIVAPRLKEVWEEVDASFERFCLSAGIEALQRLMEEDAVALCGPRHARGPLRHGYRWGRTHGKIGFHGGKVEVERPRVRGCNREEVHLASWREAVAQDWLGRWAMNLMLINVSTRKLGRAVRLPGSDFVQAAGDGTSKSAVSRRFVALSSEKMTEWLANDLSRLDLPVIQIDGLHIGQDLVLVAAIGIDAGGCKHPLGLAEGATENAAAVQAVLDNLIERGLDPAARRLFILDGAKALSKAVRRTFGQHALIQRCQVHKARNIVERCPPRHVAHVKRTLREAWQNADAVEAERLLKELARRLERDAPGVAASIREGVDEILTVSRLRLPMPLRRSLACTNAIENMQGTIRRVTRNVKRWQDPTMALRWTAAGMMEAKKGFRRLKAYRQLPFLTRALSDHAARHAQAPAIARTRNAA